MGLYLAAAKVEAIEAVEPAEPEVPFSVFRKADHAVAPAPRRVVVVVAEQSDGIPDRTEGQDVGRIVRPEDPVVIQVDPDQRLFQADGFAAGKYAVSDKAVLPQIVRAGAETGGDEEQAVAQRLGVHQTQAMYLFAQAVLYRIHWAGDAFVEIEQDGMAVEVGDDGQIGRQGADGHDRLRHRHAAMPAGRQVGSDETLFGRIENSGAASVEAVSADRGQRSR